MAAKDTAFVLATTRPVSLFGNVGRSLLFNGTLPSQKLTCHVKNRKELFIDIMGYRPRFD